MKLNLNLVDASRPVEDKRCWQWRNFGLKSEGDQAKFLTWCTPTPKKWGGVRAPYPITLRLWNLLEGNCTTFWLQAREYFVIVAEALIQSKLSQTTVRWTRNDRLDFPGNLRADFWNSNKNSYCTPSLYNI